MLLYMRAAEAPAIGFACIYIAGRRPDARAHRARSESRRSAGGARYCSCQRAPPAARAAPFARLQLVVAVNKMDSVAWDAARYDFVVKQLGVFLRGAGFREKDTFFAERAFPLPASRCVVLAS